MLPNFVILGAMRSGSSSLYRYLKDHPDVFMPHKEIQFFDRYWDRGVDWYEGLFTDYAGQLRVGEASPNYMTDATALGRMAKIIPDALLLVILRNPTDRTYSHYQMEHTRKRDARSFEQAVADELENGPSDVRPPQDYMHRSLFLPQLEAICNHYSRDQLHVALLEDFEADPTGTYVAVCEFLGIDPEIRPTTLGRTVNKHVKFRSQWLRQVRERLPDALGIRRIVDRLNVVTSDYPEMSAMTREQLDKHFAESNAALASWLGRELPGWPSS